MKVIINPSFILIRNLVEIGINNGECEKLAEGIVDIFLFYNKLSELIKELVSYELDHYSKFTLVELFKGDSLASVVIIQFFHRVGRDYLLKLITCAINPLLELYPDGFNVRFLFPPYFPSFPSSFFLLSPSFLFHHFSSVFSALFSFTRENVYCVNWQMLTSYLSQNSWGCWKIIQISKTWKHSRRWRKDC